MHHPLCHRIIDAAFFNGPRPAESAYIWDAMVNANLWYFQKTADIINEFRLQVDPQDPGGREPARSHGDPDDHRGGRGFAYPRRARRDHLRGRKLGMQGGQYQSVSGIHNQLWVTVAQAFLGADAVSKLAGEAYVKSGANPISGLWVAPRELRDEARRP